MSDSVKMGFSSSFNLEEALRDATSKLPFANPDATRRVLVTKIEADIGGNMSNGLNVTIEVENGSPGL